MNRVAMLTAGGVLLLLGDAANAASAAPPPLLCLLNGKPAFRATFKEQREKWDPDNPPPPGPEYTPVDTRGVVTLESSQSEIEATYSRLSDSDSRDVIARKDLRIFSFEQTEDGWTWKMARFDPVATTAKEISSGPCVVRDLDSDSKNH